MNICLVLRVQHVFLIFAGHMIQSKLQQNNLALNFHLKIVTVYYRSNYSLCITRAFLLCPKLKLGMK